CASRPVDVLVYQIFTEAAGVLFERDVEENPWSFGICAAKRGEEQPKEKIRSKSSSIHSAKNVATGCHQPVSQIISVHTHE
ncbi:MAG: hypothetical protein QF886_24905, partial [Planctomycetota bacterium]|nr:hypothetical protein [Planctomycetota bacterium]